MPPLLAFESVRGPFVRSPEAALQGVSLEVRPGDAMALVGHRRSGVRRVLRMALHLEAGSRGKIHRYRPPNFPHWALYLPHREPFLRGWRTAEFVRWLWMACGRRARPREVEQALRREAFPSRAPVERLPRPQLFALRLWSYLRAGAALLLAESPPEDLPQDLAERLHHWCAQHLESGGALLFLLHHRSPDPLLRTLHPEALYFCEGRLVFRGFLAELEKSIRLQELLVHGLEREDLLDLPVWRLTPDPEGWRVLVRARDREAVLAELEARGGHLLREEPLEALLAEALQL